MRTKKELRNDNSKEKALDWGRHFKGSIWEEHKDTWLAKPKVFVRVWQACSCNNKIIVRGWRVRTCALTRVEQGQIKVISWLAYTLTSISNLLHRGAGSAWQRLREQCPIL